MKRFITILFTIYACALSWAYETPSDGGKVYNIQMPSMLMNGDRNYSIYLPEGYETDTLRRYPVLYLLHGLGNTNTKGWVERGNVEAIANRVIAEHRAAKMIIVMPDAGTGGPGYFNREGWPYEDYFFQELIPYVEKNYRTLTDPSHRAIAGLSMGGGGTLVYALRHPEMFAAACPLSALVIFPTQSRNDSKWMDKYPQVRAWAESAMLTDNLPLDIINRADEQRLDDFRTVRWYIDCGDDDYLYEGNLQLYLLLRSKQIPMQYRMRDGAHDWLYWQSALPDVMAFVSQAFADGKEHAHSKHTQSKNQ